MASKILIKRSGTTGAPGSLRTGEMAYSYHTDHQKLYIGWGDETTPGQADNIGVIGGIYYTNMLDHTAGQLTASSAIIVDANSKIDNLKVDNLDLNGNTLSTTNTNGNLVLDPNGSGSVNVSTSKIINVTDPTADQHAATKKYVDDTVGAVSSNITLSDGTDTDVFTTGNTLTFDGGTGVTTTVTDDQVSFAITNTGVSAATYGSSTTIPQLAINAQGQITSASTNTISTTLNVMADNAGTGGDSSGTVALGTDTLKFVGDSSQGVQVSFNNVDKKLTIANENATTTNKGVASFSSSDFGVSSGAVTIKAGGVSNTQLAGSIANGKLTNSAVTVTAGDGLSGGGSVSLGSSVSLAVSVDDTTIETDNDTLRVKDGGVSNAKLANDSITIGTTEIDLGNASTVLAGLTQIDVDNIRIKDNTISTTDAGSPTTLTLDPNPVGDSGTVIIAGDLTVQGTTTTINSTEVSIGDLTLTLADDAANAAAANGSGLRLGATGYTATSNRPSITYSSSGDKWVSSIPIDATIVDMSETIDDRVSNLLLAGEAIDLTYNDGANSLTIDAEVATASNKGVAMFPTANFTMTNGSVAISVVDGGTYS
tara:strand:+ start:46768 stop:48555 length:1788 start_codon:yes stop_codon:yes gene_type:complete